MKAHPKDHRALEAMSRIQALYRIEHAHATDPPDKKLLARETFARPVFEQFRRWLYDQVGQVAPKSALGMAIAYAISLLPRLEVYLTDGRVPIDNNRAGKQNGADVLSSFPFPLLRAFWTPCNALGEAASHPGASRLCCHARYSL